MEGFFNSTTQNMRLNTKAETAIMLNVTSRTVSDWMISVNDSDWLVGTFDCAALLLFAVEYIAKSEVSAKFTRLEK